MSQKGGILISKESQSISRTVRGIVDCQKNGTGIPKNA
jgi:hypothetical protein